VPDHVDLVLQQWAQRRPDLDVASMAVVGRLSRLSQVVGARLRQTFAAHGLDAASFDVLATLRRSDPERPLTPAQLTHAAMVTSGAISQRLDRLEERGLVQRTPSRTDGRVVHVTLTEDGRAAIDRALPDHVATMDSLLQGLAPEQRAQLAAVLSDLLCSLGDGDGDGAGTDAEPLSAARMRRGTAVSGDRP
jgi:DNA-binding MarR family transcriptional regulator